MLYVIYTLYHMYTQYQLEGNLTCYDFLGVIAKMDFILLFTLFPAVLFPFVGVFVILFRIGVRLSSFRAF